MKFSFDFDKPIIMSKTVWGVIVFVVGAVYALSGLPVPVNAPVDGPTLGWIVATVGGAWSLFGGRSAVGRLINLLGELKEHLEAGVSAPEEVPPEEGTDSSG